MVTMEEVEEFYCRHFADADRDPWATEQSLKALYEFANRKNVGNLGQESKAGESQEKRSNFQLNENRK